MITAVPCLGRRSIENLAGLTGLYWTLFLGQEAMRLGLYARRAGKQGQPRLQQIQPQWAGGKWQVASGSWL